MTDCIEVCEGLHDMWCSIVEATVLLQVSFIFYHYDNIGGVCLNW